MKSKFILLASLLASLHTAHAITPEEMQQLIMQRLMGGVGVATQPKPIAAPQAQISEEDLLKKVESLPAPTSLFYFEKRRDGFLVNNMPFIDPEGRITNYGYDALTGEVTYLTLGIDGSYQVKMTRALSDAEPILLGQAFYSGGNWQFNSVTGKKLVGNKLILTPRGVLTVRDTAGFSWQAGKAIKSIAAPEGFVFADFQNGDVTGTSHILIERIKENSSSIGEFFSTAKALGSTLGINKKEDYALMNINTGVTIPLNIDIDSKTANFFADCKAGKIINKCNQMNSMESLYNQDGTPNMGHYFWKIHWFKTPDGLIAVSQESGPREIWATDLISGKRAMILNRTLGIGSFTARQQSDGKISLVAQMGFSKEEIKDVFLALNESAQTEKK